MAGLDRRHVAHDHHVAVARLVEQVLARGRGPGRPSVGQRLAAGGHEVRVGAPRGPHLGGDVGDRPPVERRRSRARSTARRRSTGRPNAAAVSCVRAQRAGDHPRVARAPAPRAPRPAAARARRAAGRRDPRSRPRALASVWPWRTSTSTGRRYRRAPRRGATTTPSAALLSCSRAPAPRPRCSLRSCALVGVVGVPAASARTAARDRARPDPVLLVHGFRGSASGWHALDGVARARRATADSEIDAIDYDSDASNVDVARQIAREVDALRARTGASQVDVVSHSMGAISSRVLPRTARRRRVRRRVGVAGRRQRGHGVGVRLLRAHPVPGDGADVVDAATG